MTGDIRRRRPRPLSEEERALWRAVIRSVAPLRRLGGEAAPPTDAPSQAAPVAPPVVAPLLGAPPAPPHKPVRTPAPKPSSVKVAKPLIAPPPPALAPLERRLRQRAVRGSEAIAARLDLHGFTQERAHLALLGFLRAAQRDGARLVLVITGKGGRADADFVGGGRVGERGVLRRLVPHWLAAPELRHYVVGYEAAHATHGGDGALYVRVRRAKG